MPSDGRQRPPLDQLDRLARSRDALSAYIAAAERTGTEHHPPFDGTEAVPA